MEEAAAVGERVIGEAWNLNSRHVDEEIAGLAAVIRQRAPASGRDFLVHANEYLTARVI
jgi:hypothetical protein